MCCGCKKTMYLFTFCSELFSKDFGSPCVSRYEIGILWMCRLSSNRDWTEKLAGYGYEALQTIVFITTNWQTSLRSNLDRSANICLGLFPCLGLKSKTFKITEENVVEVLWVWKRWKSHGLVTQWCQGVVTRKWFGLNPACDSITFVHKIILYAAPSNVIITENLYVQGKE